MYKKIASNTLAQVVSKALTAIISIFLIGILTKYLPIELYGSYNKVYNYLGIFAFLADLGLYTITIREISQKKHSTEKIIGNVLTLRTGLGLLIWIIAFIVALFLPGYHDPLTLTAIFVIGGFTLVSLINSSLLALMQSQMKMEFSLISVVTGKIVNVLLVAIFLMFIFTDISQTPIAFISVFVAGFIGIFCNTYLNYIYAKKIVPIRYRFDSSYIQHIFKISLPYGIALFLGVVYFKIDVILLSLIESPEMADISIALYSLPMKIVEVLMVLGGFYLNSILPTLSEKFTQKKYGDISQILGVSLKVLMSFGVLIFILGNLFAYDVISIIATQQYINPTGHMYNSVGVLGVVVGVLLFHFISLGFIYILIAAEKQGMLLWINLVVTIINIVGNIVLIPHYSFLGAAVVTLLSQILLMGISGYVVLGKTPLPYYFFRHYMYTLILGGGVFYISSMFLSKISFPSLVMILVIAPIITLIYVGGEYIFSRDIIKKSNQFQSLK